MDNKNEEKELKVYEANCKITYTNGRGTIKKKVFVMHYDEKKARQRIMDMKKAYSIHIQEVQIKTIKAMKPYNGLLLF